MKPFAIVDVFGGARYKGNPVAVVADADDLSDGEMQDITRWLNLSETAFLVQPTEPSADYCLRIFTLDREMPFAGHPTLGACRMWLQNGGVPKARLIRQQCGAGLVSIQLREPQLAFAAPPLIRSGPVGEQDLERALQVLGLDSDAIISAQWVDNGPGWLGVMLASAKAVLRVKPVRHHPTRIDIGIIGRHSKGTAADWEIRAFFSDQYRRIVEDPITGSLNASLAQWLFAEGYADRAYVARQGTAIDREGRVAIEKDSEGTIWVGGIAQVLSSGYLTTR